MALAPNSPALQSGLRTGDCILGLDDRLLVACSGGRDPAKVLRTIEAAWLARVPPGRGPRETQADPTEQVTLTVIRTTAPPIETRAPASSGNSGIFPQFAPHALLPTHSKPLVLNARGNRNNRRLPKGTLLSYGRPKF